MSYFSWGFHLFRACDGFVPITLTPKHSIAFWFHYPFTSPRKIPGNELGNPFALHGSCDAVSCADVLLAMGRLQFGIASSTSSRSPSFSQQDRSRLTIALRLRLLRWGQAMNYTDGRVFIRSWCWDPDFRDRHLREKIRKFSSPGRKAKVSCGYPENQEKQVFGYPVLRSKPQRWIPELRFGYPPREIFQNCSGKNSEFFSKV